MRKKGLTPREREFCRQYICLGDSKTAAASAGYSKNPEGKGEELLCREDIMAELGRLCQLKKQTAAELARTGYRRLAFGSIADAVSLLYMDSPSSEQLKKMDLFSVAEIKRPKDGSMEIKFFDRLKALEKLTEGVLEDREISPVYEAIRQGALALGSSEVGSDET
ncbi:MAG: terminase small subunit [Ruminococcus sp.]|nr:terminase small subunit [Ruminococcus sp.]